jgi:hypothetical protein
MGRSGIGTRARWMTDRSTIAESQVIRPFRPTGLHKKHAGPWKPFSPKTPTHQKTFLVCAFCSCPPPQGAGKTMVGWWHRKMPAVGMNHPASQAVCQKCKKALDQGRQLYPVL